MLGDRRVHAECKDYEIVRYNRSGHWWLEPKGFGNQRTMLNIRSAAQKAAEASKRRGGKIYLAEPGGTSFDRAVLKLLG